MAWEQEISEKLQEAESIAVRFDVEQELTDGQKSTARNNIGTTTTVVNVFEDNYKIVFNY